jgi:hypothetical protein
MQKYVFIDANSVVVQAIVGLLSDEQQSRFLSDYDTLYGAKSIVVVSVETPVWIGGTYTDSGFAPPETITTPADTIQE